MNRASKSVEIVVTGSGESGEPYFCSKHRGACGSRIVSEDASTRGALFSVSVPHNLAENLDLCRLYSDLVSLSDEGSRSTVYFDYDDVLLADDRFLQEFIDAISTNNELQNSIFSIRWGLNRIPYSSGEDTEGAASTVRVFPSPERLESFALPTRINDNDATKLATVLIQLILSDGGAGLRRLSVKALNYFLRRVVHTIVLDRSSLVTTLIRHESLAEIVLSYTAREDRLYNFWVALFNRDKNEAIEEIKPRIVFAGHDLKFIDFFYSEIEDSVHVRIDKWTSEKKHDHKKSRHLANWADIVWVEWLAYCAKWYSENLLRSKVLIVRCHRYEINRDVGFDIDYDNVNAVLMIATHTMEAAIEKFGLDRSIVRLIPNIYASERYVRAHRNDLEIRSKSLALVGPVPRLKGLHRALALLKILLDVDDSFTLTVFGRLPEDLPWILSDDAEYEYYKECMKMLDRLRLRDHVEFKGWVDLRTELRNYGFVLSMSDIEGSHVSPGEAFLTDNMGIYLRWPGVDYVYPPQFGFDSVVEMAEFILKSPFDSGEILSAIEETRLQLSKNQGMESFLRSVQSILDQSFMDGRGY